MIECLPLGICSWSFSLKSDGHHGVVEPDWVGEQGVLFVDGVRHAIRKHGMFSGFWSLERDGRVMAEAEKTSAFTRSFRIRQGGDTWTLRAPGIGRAMVLEGPGGRTRIEPAHPFTRRATMCPAPPDFVMSCFAFWLTVLLWRRSANSAAASSSAG